MVNGRYSMMLDIYRLCGYCLKKLQRFQESLLYYKRMMRVAWDIGNREYERLGFDLMGMGYFYLGDMENAKMCHKLVKEGYSKGNPNNGICESMKIDIIMELKRREFEESPKNDVANPRTLFTPMNENFLQEKYLEEKHTTFVAEADYSKRDEY